MKSKLVKAKDGVITVPHAGYWELVIGPDGKLIGIREVQLGSG